MAYTDTGTPESGNGSVLQLGLDTSPQTWQTIALIAGDITGFGISSSKLNTTHQNNPDGHTTSTLGLKDPGEPSIKCFWDPEDETLNGATEDGLWALANSQEARNWRFLGGRDELTSEYWTFRAQVMKMTFGLPLNDIKFADITMNISGKMTHSSEA